MIVTVVSIDVSESSDDLLDDIAIHPGNGISDYMVCIGDVQISLNSGQFEKLWSVLNEWWTLPPDESAKPAAPARGIKKLISEIQRPISE